MTKAKKIELIKSHRNDILTRIEQVEVLSLTPSFYGTYDLYMDEEGELYVFQIFHETCSRNRELIFLCSIESNATDDKVKFRSYLKNEWNIPALDEEKNLFKIHSFEYGLWKRELIERVKQNVIDADLLYEDIVEYYEALEE